MRIQIQTLGDITRRGERELISVLAGGIAVLTALLVLQVFAPTEAEGGSGPQRRALTPLECEAAKQALERAQPEFEQFIALLHQRASIPQTEEKTVRAWFSDELQRARLWADQGCPDDGVRGVYWRPGSQNISLQLFVSTSPPVGQRDGKGVALQIVPQ